MPCGISDATVTSLSRELGRTVPVGEALPLLEARLPALSAAGLGPRARVTLVRTGTGLDEDAAVAVWQAAEAGEGRRSGGSRAQRLRARLRGPLALLLVAEQDGAPVGVLLAEVDRVDGLVVSLLAVLPPAQRTGVGRALLEHLLARYPQAAVRLDAEDHALHGVLVRVGLQPVARPGRPGSLFLQRPPRRPAGLTRPTVRSCSAPSAASTPPSGPTTTCAAPSTSSRSGSPPCARARTTASSPTSPRTARTSPACPAASPTSRAVHDAWHLLADAGRVRHRDTAPARGRLVRVGTSGGGRAQAGGRPGPGDRRSGLEGDAQADRRNHGRPWQAVSLWSADVVAGPRRGGPPAWARATPARTSPSPGSTGPTVRPGVQLLVGSVLLEVTTYAVPCKKIAAVFSDGRFRRIAHEAGPGAGLRPRAGRRHGRAGRPRPARAGVGARAAAAHSGADAHASAGMTSAATSSRWSRSARSSSCRYSRVAPASP